MKREWILTDEQKQIKRVKIMQNKQSRTQKASTSPSHSVESATTTTTNNLGIYSSTVVANDSAAATTNIENATTPIDVTAQSPNRNINSSSSSSSENNNLLEISIDNRSQVSDSNNKVAKINQRRFKQHKDKQCNVVVVETRDASTSCPDEFDLLNPHMRALQHCSFASQCQYCSLRLFGTPTSTTVTTTGGQPMCVDYQQHLQHQLNNQHHYQHHQQLLLHQQHPLNDSQASHRIPPLYGTPLTPSEQLDHVNQNPYSALSNHQVNADRDSMILNVSSSTPAATATPITGCCNCNLDNPINLNSIETRFNHHDNNSQIIQPIPSNCPQTTNSQSTSPQLHLMTPSHHVSNTAASVGNDTTGGDCGGDGNGNLISWNNEFFGQPAQTEAELKSRLDKLDFLDSEKQVIHETTEATRFIFESSDNMNHKVCDFLNDIVMFCDAALRRLITTVKQIKSFRMLNMDDQIILLKTACFKILLLRSTYHFSDEWEGWIDHRTGKVMALDTLKRAKKSLVYERHRDLVKKMPGPLRKDRFIVSIMAMTLLFDPTTNLKHGNSVTLDNLTYLSLLRKYLLCTQPDPLNKYETLVAVLQVIKACNDEYTNFFSKDFQPEQITPLLIEIFDIPTVQCDT